MHAFLFKLFSPCSIHPIRVHNTPIGCRELFRVARLPRSNAFGVIHLICTAIPSNRNQNRSTWRINPKVMAICFRLQNHTYIQTVEMMENDGITIRSECFSTLHWHIDTTTHNTAIIYNISIDRHLYSYACCTVGVDGMEIMFRMHVKSRTSQP